MTFNRTEQLRQIRDEIVALESSPLYAERIKNGTHPVIGEGSHFARVMMVGEAPGRNEAATGRPFVGAAGKILNELLESADIKREDVYITNIVKDRPPFNRDPLPEEIEVYGSFLDRQIDIIRPEVIVPLGRYAMGYIMERLGCKAQLAPISKMHGTVIQASLSYGVVHIVPLYHPCVAIYNASTKDTLKADIQVLRQFDCAPMARNTGDESNAQVVV